MAENDPFRSARQREAERIITGIGHFTRYSSASERSGVLVNTSQIAEMHASLDILEHAIEEARSRLPAMPEDEPAIPRLTPEELQALDLEEAARLLITTSSAYILSNRRIENGLGKPEDFTERSIAGTTFTALRDFHEGVTEIAQVILDEQAVDNRGSL